MIAITLTSENSGVISETNRNKLLAAQTGTVDVVIIKQDSTKVLCTMANFGRSSQGYSTAKNIYYRIFGVNINGSYYININMLNGKAQLSWVP